MSYNKASAEKEWLKWKTAEEKKLRELGVDEDTIQCLHIYDWEAFKRERNYQRWNIQSEEYINQQTIEKFPEIKNIEQLLDDIENPHLYKVLSSTDKLTLQIILYKIQGFNSLEIAKMTGLTETNVRQRLSRLKKKF
ncbi:sigma factor-like helix-turn-helix DNA-binding protein [Massiliimalia timonensis]|uniref:sigma factor-like helix-turn-helix DNA-binding protein n=1 Tax=Massiliimalia timonensis TaxID=1987501 RepID=UPI00189C7321|nr:sigma factor-like helix-turn-helix DNA-binding protein [Massiliimalia timonensis]